MQFFNELIILESEISAQKEIKHVIAVINTIYAEWKKRGRRKNAVDIITTTANKLSNINASVIDRVHESTRLKLASLLVRCFDIPYWKPIEDKEKIYKKLYPLLSKMQSYDPNIDSKGDVKSAICTRLSSSICYNSDNKKIFVAYEPTISNTYLRYLFGNDTPEKTYRMQTLLLPEDFNTLIQSLKIDHNKAITKFNAEQTVRD